MESALFELVNKKVIDYVDISPKHPEYPIFGPASAWQFVGGATPPPSPGTAPAFPPERQAHRLTPGRGFAVPEEQGRASMTPQRYQQRPLGSDEHPGLCCRNTPQARRGSTGIPRAGALT